MAPKAESPAVSPWPVAPFDPLTLEASGWSFAAPKHSPQFVSLSVSQLMALWASCFVPRSTAHSLRGLLLRQASTRVPFRSGCGFFEVGGSNVRLEVRTTSLAFTRDPRTTASKGPAESGANHLCRGRPGGWGTAPPAPAPPAPPDPVRGRTEPTNCWERRVGISPEKTLP